MILNTYKNKNGSVLVSVIVVFTVLTILGTAALSLMSSEYIIADRSYDQMQAYYLARAGADICASYIVDNPDHLSSTQMDEFLDTIIAYGTSSNTKLESTSQDYFNITVTENGDTINILSTGTVPPNAQASVSLTLKKESIGLGLDAAVYINNDSLAQNSATINGDVVLTNADAELTLENSAEVTGSVGVAEQVFEMPVFPGYPTGFSASTIVSPALLTSNTYYTNGLNIANYNITVDVGNSDFIIRTKSLEVTNGSSITVNRYGSGRFIIFIDPGSDVSLLNNTSYFNRFGSSDDVIIYCNIGDKTFMIRNSSILNAGLYVIAGKLTFENSSQYSGHIVFEGTIEGQGIEFENSSTIGNTIVYAPTSFVLFENSFSANGTIVAGELQMDNSSIINYAEIESSYLLDSVLNETAYFKKYYN